MKHLLLALLLVGCAGGSTASDDTASDDTAGDGNGSGPVLSGLERYCEAYKTCGGTYYETAEDCVQASLDYWGACPSRRDALDTFGDCMADVPCDDYDPDSYNPAGTVCADAWSALQSSPGC